MIDSSDLFHIPGVAFAGGSTAEVSIQVESQRTVTLPGVNIEVKDLGPRPAGCVFDIDLDSNPPRLVDAWSWAPGRFRPITFPWEVSPTDPLLLDVSAST